MTTPDPHFHFPCVGRWGSPRMFLDYQAPATNAGAVWPSGAANRALYVPMIFPRTLTVRNLMMCNEGNGTGTMDMALYTFAGVRIAWAGGAVARTINVNQHMSVTSVTLTPGWYYLGGVASEVAAGTYTTAPVPSVRDARAAGLLEETLGSTSMPATMTATTLTSAARIPFMGVCSSATL